MKKYGLTARTFLTRFSNLCKGTHDTYILFASKLEGLLRQYLEARKAKYFETLVSLLISDRIKSSLSDQCMRYVLSLENNQVAADTGSKLKPSRLSELVDEYIATVEPGPGTCARATYIGQPQSQLQSQSQPGSQLQSQSQSVEGRNQVNGRGRGAVAANVGNTAGWNDKSQKDFAKPASTAAHFRNANGRRCTICDSPNHLRTVCPKRADAPVRVNNTTARPTDQQLQSQSQSQSVEGRNQVNGRGRGAGAANAVNTAGWNSKKRTLRSQQAARLMTGLVLDHLIFPLSAMPNLDQCLTLVLMKYLMNVLMKM